MTGQELIDFIKEEHLENCEIAFDREPGEEPDLCYGSIFARKEETEIGTVWVI